MKLRLSDMLSDVKPRGRSKQNPGLLTPIHSKCPIITKISF